MICGTRQISSSQFSEVDGFKIMRKYGENTFCGFKFSEENGHLHKSRKVHGFGSTQNTQTRVLPTLAEVGLWWGLHIYVLTFQALMLLGSGSGSGWLCALLPP